MINRDKYVLSQFVSMGRASFMRQLSEHLESSEEEEEPATDDIIGAMAKAASVSRKSVSFAPGGVEVWAFDCSGRLRPSPVGKSRRAAPTSEQHGGGSSSSCVPVPVHGSSGASCRPGGESAKVGPKLTRREQTRKDAKLRKEICDLGGLDAHMRAQIDRLSGDELIECAQKALQTIKQASQS